MEEEEDERCSTRDTGGMKLRKILFEEEEEERRIYTKCNLVSAAATRWGQRAVAPARKRIRQPGCPMPRGGVARGGGAEEEEEELIPLKSER